MNILRAPFKSTLQTFTTIASTVALLAASLVAAPPAHAALDGSGSGTISCTGGGHATVEANVVTGNTECAGSIEIPAAITGISPDAFVWTATLTGITFVSSSTQLTIGSYAFYGTQLKSIVIPSRVSSIGAFAFEGNRSLTSVKFEGDAPSLLGGNAFLGVGANATAAISQGAIFGSPTNPATGATWNGLIVVRAPDVACSDGGYVDLVDEVNPDSSTKTVVSQAYNCKGSVEIPANVTAINAGAFKSTGVTDFFLTSITFATGSLLTSIGAEAFYQARALTSIVVPAGVTSIGSRAFQSAGALTAVTFATPSALTSLGSHAFNEATALTSIEIPAGVTRIESRAFQITPQLSSVTFAAGSTLTQIGSAAFFESGLTSITIPVGVTSIETQAFRLAGSLSTVTFLGDAPTVVGDSPFTTSNSFDGISANAVAKVGTTASFGLTGSLWNNRLKVQREGDVLCSTFGYFSITGTTVTSQASCAGAAVIPATVTHIGNAAFKNVTSVTSLTFASPSSLHVIGIEAFAGMSGITSVVIPANVLGISDLAFERNSSLSSVIFAGTALTLIGNSAFKDSTSLTSIEIPDSVTAIGGEAFAGSSNLANVRFLGSSAPATVVDTAFSRVKALATATISDGATGFGAVRSTWNGLIIRVLNQTTVDCSVSGYFVIDTTEPEAPSLVESGPDCAGIVTVPAEVTFIEESAFENVPLITKIQFEENSSLTVIGEAAFAGMNLHLVEVEIPAGVTHIRPRAFSGVDYLESIVLPASLLYLGHEAFDSTGLLSVTFLGNAPTVGLDGANPGDPFSGVPDLAKAFITELATGFGDGPTWNGLTIVRAVAPSAPSAGSTGVTAPVVTPPVVVAPKPMAKQISLNQIVAKLLANGVPVLKGRSASKQVEFTASSARLDATDWATLRKVAASFTGKKGKLIVVGFVSGKGQTKTSAQKVAAARAKNVSMALVSLGVDFEIGYAGFGARNKAKPTAIDNRVDFRWIASN